MATNNSEQSQPQDRSRQDPTIWENEVGGITRNMRSPEYDLRGGVRGKYYERYKQGSNVVLLEPDMAKLFRDSATVNETLRRYLSEHGTPPERKEAD